jgi:hypothetical protein
MKDLVAKALAVALLASLVACDETPAHSVPPDVPDGATPDSDLSTFPDSSLEDTAPPSDACPASALPDAPLCSGNICGYVPPPFNPVVMQACTPANVDAYVTACGPSDFSPECLAWKADPANATCKSCVLRTDGSGPLLYYNDGTFAQINEAACLAIGGAQDCGATTNASYYCLFEACGACPLDGGQVTGACYETVSQGDCAGYANAQAACESTLTGPVTACEATMGTFATQLHMTVTLLCGIPGDGGGSSDSGADGASEASAGEAGPGDSGPSDAGPGDAGPADAAQE